MHKIGDKVILFDECIQKIVRGEVIRVGRRSRLGCFKIKWDDGTISWIEGELINPAPKEAE